MEKETYNGWTNYATWRIKLELWDDDAWIDDEVRFDHIADLVEYLQERTDEVLTGYGEAKENTFALSYARAFVSDVNWYEIARHIVEDYPQIIKA